MIEDDWYLIEYEGLHVICARCGCYGHKAKDCGISEQRDNNSAESSMVKELSLVGEGLKGGTTVNLPEKHRLETETEGENNQGRAVTKLKINAENEGENHGDNIMAHGEQMNVDRKVAEKQIVEESFGELSM
ncbi:hypothetical protein OROGR_001447 [Orobanche gracilis]